jgi:hypothetical protein
MYHKLLILVSETYNSHFDYRKKNHEMWKKNLVLENIKEKKKINLSLICLNLIQYNDKKNYFVVLQEEFEDTKRYSESVNM